MDKTAKIFRCAFVCIILFAIFLIFVNLERPVTPKHLKTKYDNTSKIFTVENLSSKQTNFYSKLVCKIYLGEWHYEELEFDIGPYETIELNLSNHFVKEQLETKTISSEVVNRTTFLGKTIAFIIALAAILLVLTILIKQF